ncbi:DUF4402 domain-containing protein, partial [Candidatus Woesearchaeota archaeon]|nr:DUF4402 domain-containing protein [Candidatus Woesearchaeota archaeon]
MKHIIWVAVALMLLAGVLAAGDLTVTRTSVGSLSTKAKQTITGTFTVQNTGASQLSVALPGTITLSGNQSQSAAVTYSQASPLSLNAGATESLSFTFVVPNSLKSGTFTTPFNLTAGGGNFGDFSLQLTQKAALTIEDVDVTVNRKEDNNKNNGDKISEPARPGDPITVNVRVKNNFLDDSKIDMNNVLITVSLLNVGTEDIEEESDEFDMDPGKDAGKLFSFRIPQDVDEGDYELIIFVEADDDDGVQHTVDWRLELEVDKLSHDSRVTKAEFSQPQVQCGSTAYFDVEVTNFGSNEEDQTRLKITNSDLGVNILEREFHLGNDLLEDESRFAKRFQIPVPSTAKPGTYTIRTEMFIDTDNLDDFVDRSLIVTCPVKETSPQPEQQGKEEPKQEGQPQANGSGQQPGAPGAGITGGTVITETSDEGGNRYLLPLIISNVALLAIVIIGAVLLW